MCDKCPNTKVFLVRIFPYLDWKWRFTTEFFLVQVLPYSNQKNLVKRNIVFGYILMYGDALPIVGNKFSKILIFLLIIFVFCQNRVGSLIQICFLLFCIFEPLRSKRFIVSLLSVAPLSCFWCFFFAWSQLVIMKGKWRSQIFWTNQISSIFRVWCETIFFCLLSIFAFNRAQELLWYTWSYVKFRTETPWRSKSAPKYRSSRS